MSSPSPSPQPGEQPQVSRLVLDCVAREKSEEFSPRAIQCVGNYDLGKTIGKGQFGKVKVARHVLTGEQVAVKIIRKRKLDESALKLIRREIYVMKMLEHPNIIRLYEVLETKRVLFLIMEYASGGEALDYVVARGKMSEDGAQKLFYQLLLAIEYCHNKLVCHRDLKAENLLLDEDLNVKVIDFGLSRLFDPGTLLTTFCGSPTYAAPELINKEPYHGPAVDIWSMGVVLYVLVAGAPPFNAEPGDLLGLYKKVITADFTVPDFVSAECSDLIRRMLVVDPAQRGTIEELKEHPWLRTAPLTANVVADLRLALSTAEPISRASSELNQSVLDQMSLLGFSESQVKDSLDRNTYDSAAATYRLLVDKLGKTTSAPQIDSVRVSKSVSAQDSLSHPEWTEDMSSFLSQCVSQPTSAATSPRTSPPQSPNPFASVPNASAAGMSRRRPHHEISSSSGSSASPTTSHSSRLSDRREQVALRRQRMKEKRMKTKKDGGHKRSNSETLASLAQIVQQARAEQSAATNTSGAVGPTGHLRVGDGKGDIVLDGTVSMPVSPEHSPPFSPVVVDGRVVSISEPVSPLVQSPDNPEMEKPPTPPVLELPPAAVDAQDAAPPDHNSGAPSEQKRRGHRRFKSMEGKGIPGGPSIKAKPGRGRSIPTTAPLLAPPGGGKERRSSAFEYGGGAPRAGFVTTAAAHIRMEEERRNSITLPSAEGVTDMAQLKRRHYRVAQRSATGGVGDRRSVHSEANVARLREGSANKRQRSGRSTTVSAPRLLPSSREGIFQSSPSLLQNQEAQEPVAEATVPQSPVFNKLLADIKSMLESQGDGEGNPRVANFKCPRAFTSMKTPEEILTEVKRVLGLLHMRFMANDSCSLEVLSNTPNVRFEAEVCSVPNLSRTYFLRVKRIAGDWMEFQAICNTLAAHLQL